MSAGKGFPGQGKALGRWRDRLGYVHVERRPHNHRANIPSMERVVGPLEGMWTEPASRARLRTIALAYPNPLVFVDIDDPVMSTWTWTILAPGARAVLLWTNPVFDHENPARAEFARLPESHLWTISLRLPSALRCSYRIAVWDEDAPPPWRIASDERPIARVAFGLAAPDPRAADVVIGSAGEPSSVAAGPAAPRQLWNSVGGAPKGGHLEELTLASGDVAWVYVPEEAASPTPLLVLYDGAVWKRMLPQILDQLIGEGVLPPLHVAMLDARDRDYRWDNLGIPGGQVDVVLDHLLPAVRSRFNVSSRGADTIVSGQSLGGIAALWSLAFGDGEVGHAIAQSPSLWRFDVAEALLRASGWQSVELQAGTFEGGMLAAVSALADSLRADPRTGTRAIEVTAVEAGHDWAAWRVNLVSALVRKLNPAHLR